MIVEDAWPPQADVTPLLDAILALGDDDRPHDRDDEARTRMAMALARCVDPSPVLDRLCEARVAGYPGPWKHLDYALNPLLEQVPEEALRPTVARALESDDARTVYWALRLHFRAPFATGTDAPALSRARAVMAKPRLREVVMSASDLRSHAIADLRTALRVGELDYPDAARTIATIGDLYGGVAGHHMLLRRKNEPARKADWQSAQRAKRRAALEGYLGPRKLAGPPTKTEWAALRRARDAARPVESRFHLELWSNTLTDGPWTAEELAELDMFFEAFRAGAKGHALTLAAVLRGKPDESLLPRFDILLAQCDPRGRGPVRTVLAETRISLGLPPRPPEPKQHGAEAGGSAVGGDDWPEEEDDSDDGE
jgi:hypothetical protein